MKKLPGQVGTVWWVDTKVDWEPVTYPEWYDKLAMLGLKCPGSRCTVTPQGWDEPDIDFGCNEIALDRCGDPVDIELVDRPMGNAIWHPSAFASVLKRDLYQAIERELPPHVVGACYLIYDDDSRDLIEDYVTCYVLPEHRITFRGERGSIYYVCDTCRRGFLAMTYNPEQSGGSVPRSYILQRELSEYNATLAEENGAVLLTPALKDAIDWSLFPDAELIEYPVLDAPIDGIVLPCDED